MGELNARLAMAVHMKKEAEESGEARSRETLKKEPILDDGTDTATLPQSIKGRRTKNNWRKASRTEPKQTSPQ
jgi:hypothetical protein